MYIPKQYKEENREEIIAFMKQYSFATIVTANDNYPSATHLPLTIKEQGDQLIVSGHFAKANEQWKEITDRQVLVIFSEPHAYISPKHYDKVQNVPTWNYISVHAYGKAKIVEEVSLCMEALEGMINSYEPEYQLQWNSLPEDYKLKMLKGIVVFEIEVTELQAKKKLSQNKTEAERQRIISSLSVSGHENERLIAGYMKHML